MRLPVRLEKKLTELFPRVREREKFVSDVIEAALTEKSETLDVNQPHAIGGTLHLFTDGGSRGNPGQAAIGCLLVDPKTSNILEEKSERIGIQTNNVAEYEALIAGLKLATHYHPNELVCHLDSELVVRQLNGEYRIKMATLAPLVEEIQELSKEFPSITFKHIPRAENFRADTLVNHALDHQ
jgi:ribonuclease HI